MAEPNAKSISSSFHSVATNEYFIMQQEIKFKAHSRSLRYLLRKVSAEIGDGKVYFSRELYFSSLRRKSTAQSCRHKTRNLIEKFQFAEQKSSRISAHRISENSWLHRLNLNDYSAWLWDHLSRCDVENASSLLFQEDFLRNCFHRNFCWISQNSRNSFLGIFANNCRSKYKKFS